MKPGSDAEKIGPASARGRRTIREVRGSRRPLRLMGLAAGAGCARTEREVLSGRLAGVGEQKLIPIMSRARLLATKGGVPSARAQI